MNVVTRPALVGSGGLFLPEVCRLHAAGDANRASDVFDAYLPLVRYEQQPVGGLSVRKYVLAKRGIIASPALRKPGKALGGADCTEVDRLIARQTRRLADLRVRDAPHTALS